MLNKSQVLSRYCYLPCGEINHILLFSFKYKDLKPIKKVAMSYHEDIYEP
jgi:hypothetical protein